MSISPGKRCWPRRVSKLALAGDGRFGWLGLAPAEGGQTLQEVESTLGAHLQALSPQAKIDGACQKREVVSQPGVVYVLDQDVVTRVETRGARHATASGVRVGGDAAKAQRVYGERLTVTPNVHFAKGQTRTVYSQDRKFALMMEGTDAGRIIMLRGGLVPTVELLEGCSG